MRYPPDDNEEREKELKRQAVDPWMMDQLDRNWGYLGWGPHEDYMWIKDLSHPDSPRRFPTWRAFRKGFAAGRHPESRDDRSGGEVVGWYFSLAREVHECTVCEGSGENSATKRLSEDWYDFKGTGRQWVDKLEQPEVDALLAQGRCRHLTHVRSRAQLDQLVAAGELTAEAAEQAWDARDRKFDRLSEETAELESVWVQWRDAVPAEEVNRKMGGAGLNSHDAINRWICVRARAERLGVYGLCEKCHGDGHIPVDLKGHLQLVLWIINPLTGQSYGLEVDNIEREELDDVYDFLSGMRDRLVSALTLPEPPRVMAMPGSGEPVFWAEPGSVLERADKGWASEAIFDSWKEFCWPTDWKIGDEENDHRIPEDHPKFAERYTGDPQWTLDDLNELVRVQVGRDPSGRTIDRAYFWMILPRKGASKRITVKNLREEDLPSLRRWVGKARGRAARRMDPGVTAEE